MKNTIKTVNFVLGGAILAVAFVAILGAFPGTAAAYWNGYHYDYQYQDSYCPYPQQATIAPNGYYTCTYPSGPAYQPAPQPYIPPALTASCYANTSSASLGDGVTWSANASGGYGSYSYTWYGTDSLSGYGQSIYKSYYNPGLKTASVVVSSGGQSVTVNCGNTVNVYGYQQASAYTGFYSATYVQPQPIINAGPTILSTNVSGLDIGCYSDPANAHVNQPVTWNVEVTGGVGPYTYTWTGTDGLVGSSNTIVKYYQSAGDKSAVVTVTSADGRTGTRACSNAVSVKRVGAAPVKTVVVPAQPAQNEQTNLSGAALFSLGNVPWGWVAVLVILVLFITVMYLLFNRTKI